MSFFGVGFSLVLNGLLLKLGSDAAIAASSSGAPIRSPAAAAAPIPSAAAPAAINLRRFTYTLLSVISDERMSPGLRISIWLLPTLSTWLLDTRDGQLLQKRLSEGELCLLGFATIRAKGRDLELCGSQGSPKL